MKSRTEEQNLIGQIRAGRSDLFNNLVDGEREFLHSFAVRRLRNPADAEDVVQESLSKAFFRLEQFRGESSFRTWLCSIVFNECRMRARLMRSETQLDPNSWQSWKHAEHQRTGTSPLEALVRRENSARIQHAVSKLPERYQHVLRLRFVEGETVAETARLLAISIPATKTWQHRGCEMLRRRLAGAQAAIS